MCEGSVKTDTKRGRSRKKPPKALIVINAESPEEKRVALVVNGRLQAFQMSTTTHVQTRGNIYKGLVENVEQGLNAAFVNIGLRKNAYLPFQDIHPEYYGYAERTKPMKEVLKKGQEILVQIVKEETELKGAAVTTYLSIPGRYLVLMPGNEQRGVSRKIEDEGERKRLKEILKAMKLPEGVGVIARTASSGVAKTHLQKDLRYLARLWEDIKKKAATKGAPCLVYRERDIVIRFLRDNLSTSVEEIVVDSRPIYDEICNFIKIIAPRQLARVKLYTDQEPIFSHYHIEEQIDQVFSRRVELPSGGFIVIEPTEALVSIDVNSGKHTKEKDLEETALQTNLEAAEEAARQLRLRDLGGIIVVDFIDMRYKKSRQMVERHMRACLKEDRAKTDCSTITKFGLLAIARQKLGSPVELEVSRPCPACGGRGLIKSIESIALSHLRTLRSALLRELDTRSKQFLVKMAPDVAQFMLNQKRDELVALENSFKAKINILWDSNQGWEEISIEEERGE